MNKDLALVKNIEDKVLVVGGQMAILDADVAEFYGVETREINQAVRNNKIKFPDGYVINFDSRKEAKNVIKNFDNIDKLKKYPGTPKLFTEKGLYMLATILKGKKAALVTIEIIETFAKLREFGRILNQSADTSITAAKRKQLTERGTEIIKVILDDALDSVERETSFELNFAMVKVKHSIKTTKNESVKKKKEGK